MSSFQAFGLVVIVQVTVISFAAVLLMILSQKSAALRHSTGFVGLILVLCGPILAKILPATFWHGRNSPAAAPTSSLVVSASRQKTPLVEERRFDEPVIESAARAPSPAESSAPQDGRIVENKERHRSVFTNDPPSASSQGWGEISLRGVLNLAGLLWIVGSAVLLARWGWQYSRLRWLLRSLSIASEAEGHTGEAVREEVCRALGLRHLPPFLVSDLIPMAMVLGIWRPRIVLPRELMECGDSTRLRDVLIHECAHVVRGDLWINAAQRVVSSLWWWHPGVIWLNALLSQSREEVCDNFVLRHGDAPTYAQTLLELSELCTSRRDYATAIGLFGSRWTLESRIIGLLKPERNTMTTTKRTTVVLIAALLGTICLLVGGVRGVDQPPSKSEAKERAEAAEPKPAKEEKDKNKVPPPANEVVKSKPKLKTVTGRVIDDKDQPVAGAQLWWVVSWDVPGVIVKEVSDEQGRFSMSTPDIAPRLPSLTHNALWVLHKGKQLARAWATSLPDENGKPAELLVRLQAETDTSFIVKSPDQKPMAGVRVEPLIFNNDTIPEETRKIIGATTDAEGRARMPSMPRKKFFQVQTISDTYGTQEFRVDGLNPPAERTLELRVTGGIEGQLFASNPAWIRGVDLWFSTQGEFRTAEGSARAKTNDEGKFTVPKIAAGELRFGIFGMQPKDAPALPRIPDRLSISEGITEKLNITLEEPVVVRGTIRTDDTDKPIPGAEITVRYGIGLQGARAVSDADGRYEARVLSGPVYTHANVYNKEFSTYQQTGSPWEKGIEVPSQATPFDLPPIRLISTLPLKGKIIDQDDRPVAKVRINGVQGNRRYGFGTTNEMGEFVAQIPKTIALDHYEVWLDDDYTRITPTVEKTDPLILRITVPRK
jgi:beta-lactamase regulating signal transducer with metallopeptidase domain